MNENYVLEAKDWVTLMKVMDFEEGNCVLEHLGMTITCENELSQGTWCVRIKDNTGKIFSIEDIEMANRYLQNIDRNIECEECDVIEVTFDKENDFIPTKHLTDFTDKTYKTLNYARMVGISIVEFIYKKQHGKEYPNFDMISGKFI